MSTARQTRGFLFADLRDYSRFTERHGDDAAARLLARYRSLVRDAIARFEGAEIRTEGDSFYVVFTSVGSAVNAGLAVLDGAKAAATASDEAPIRVGIGIHAGETVDGDQGIVSSAVNIAARVCSAAGPGELLVTETVRGLVRGYLAVQFTPVGSRKLKGLAEPMPLFRVQVGTGTIKTPRTISRFIVVAGAITAILVLLIGVAASAGSFNGLFQARSPTHSAAASTSAPPDGEASRQPSRSSPPASASPSYPTEAEDRLLALINADLHRLCQRAAFEDGPVWLAYGARDDPPLRQVVPALAGIECRLGGVSAPNTLRYWQLGTLPLGIYGPHGPDEVVAAIAGRAEAVGTSCASRIPAVEDWSYGGSSGRLTCYETETGDAVMWWTFDGTDLVGHAVRDDRDMAALLEWWNGTARFGP